MKRVQFRRRREGKTDYKKRKELLKSGKPRVIFRKSNRYITSQYVLSTEAQDKVILGFDSRELLKYGWPKNKKGSLKSLPASYLSGYLLGKKILKENLENPIVDFGIIRMLHKTAPFAFLKGLVDSGIDIKTKEETFPSEEKIKGLIKEDFDKIKSNIDKL